MKIIIEEYNHQWPVLFAEEKKHIKKVLNDAKCTIEHIGSTAVEGLGAKPVIDILIGLHDFTTADLQIEKITCLGYQYIDTYEDVMPYRRFFIKEKELIRTHHIHMVEIHTDFYDRHLAFRDYLREHADIKLQYYALKKELSCTDWNNPNDYAAAKTDFIRSIESKARQNPQ